MTLPMPLIDHVVVNARDRLDEAAALWARLGFQVTPRGHHTLGSSNNLMILGNDYIELLGVLGEAQRTDVLDWPAGLNGIVFKTMDSDGLHATLQAAEAPVLPPQAFSRPVDMGDGRHAEAAFRTVRMEAGALPAGRMFFCHHLAPELVWHEPWRQHPNRVTGIKGVTLAVRDVEACVGLMRRVFGAEALLEGPTGAFLVAGLAWIAITSSERLATHDPEVAEALAGRADAMVELTLCTASVDAVRAALEAGGIEFRSDMPFRIVVPPSQAGGLRLEFIQ